MLDTDSKQLFSINSQSIQTLLATGDPVHAVLKVAKEMNATLIAAGTTGKNGVMQLLMGSYVRRLLYETHVPLLLTHAPK